jgi:hypothetical protein
MNDLAAAITNAVEGVDSGNNVVSLAEASSVRAR